MRTNEQKSHRIPHGLYKSASGLVRRAPYSESCRDEIRKVLGSLRRDWAWYRAVEAACKCYGMDFETSQPAETIKKVGEAKPETAWLCMQQGGSTTEWYAYTAADLDDIDAFRRDCWEKGAYSTTDPIEIPAGLLEDRSVVMELAEGIAISVSKTMLDKLFP